MGGRSGRRRISGRRPVSIIIQERKMGDRGDLHRQHHLALQEQMTHLGVV